MGEMEQTVTKCEHSKFAIHFDAVTVPKVIDRRARLLSQLGFYLHPSSTLEIPLCVYQTVCNISVPTAVSSQ